MADETSTLTLLKTVPPRVARDLNDWANGLKDDSAQKPVLQRLAETIEDLGNFLEPRPTGSIAIYCLRANDTVTGAVEHALNAQFPAAYRSQDMLPPVDDCNDAYYLKDPRFAKLMDGIQARGEGEAEDTTWDFLLRRGLNRVCTGRKKGDPVRVVFEIVIEFVNKFADPSVTWPNTAVKEFVTAAKDRVRNTLAAHSALKGPQGPGADHDEDEFASPPVELPPGTRAAAPPPRDADPPTLSAPKPGGKGGKASTEDDNALDNLQAANAADLRRQVSALQDELVTRLTAADQEKKVTVNTVRDELQSKLNAMEDDRDRKQIELTRVNTELERLKAVERKYDTLRTAHEALKDLVADASKDVSPLPDDVVNTDVEELRTQLAETFATLAESDQALHAELARSSQLQAQLDVAETTIRECAVDLDESYQEINRLRERLEAASAVPASTGIAPSPTADPAIEHDTPPMSPPISADLFADLQDLGEMVAKFGGLIVKTAQRGR